MKKLLFYFFNFNHILKSKNFRVWHLTAACWNQGVDGISFTVHPMGGRGPSDPHPTVRVAPIRMVVNRTELSPAPPRQVSGAASPDSAIQCLHLFAPYVKYKVENIMKELTQLPTQSVADLQGMPVGPRHTLRNPVQYKSNSSCHRQSTYASVRTCLTVSRHVLPLAQSPQATYHVPSKFYGYSDLPLSPLATAGLEPAGYQN